MRIFRLIFLLFSSFVQCTQIRKTICTINIRRNDLNSKWNESINFDAFRCCISAFQAKRERSLGFYAKTFLVCILNTLWAFIPFGYMTIHCTWMLNMTKTICNIQIKYWMKMCVCVCVGACDRTKCLAFNMLEQILKWACTWIKIRTVKRSDDEQWALYQQRNAPRCEDNE